MSVLMEANIIAKSGSGKTWVVLNPDNTIGFNSPEPIMSLGNLKWLRMQPWFKQGFLSRISDDYLRDVGAVELDIKNLPVSKRYLMIQHHPFIRSNYAISCVRTYYNSLFCHFSNTDDISFVGNTPLMTRPTYGEEAVEVSTTGPVDQIIADFEAKRQVEYEKAIHSNQVWLEEMNQPLKGWYVVTLDVSVSKIRGNDGVKTYSFKVLAENQMDAYEKAVNVVYTQGLDDKNVAFVYEVKDSAKSALIEFVGIWTDEAELEYGPTA